MTKFNLGDKDSDFSNKKLILCLNSRTYTLPNNSCKGYILICVNYGFFCLVSIFRTLIELKCFTVKESDENFQTKYVVSNWVTLTEMK